MQELLEDQEIIYAKNGEEISRVTRATFLPEPLAGYVRLYQPFTKAGNDLTIPIVDRQTTKRASVKAVSHEGNVLTVTTKSSTYTITYVNIDLEKILADGEFKGVNDTIDHPTFPHT